MEWTMITRCGNYV